MQDDDRPRKRKGKALLVASVGIATVSFVACNEPQRPVGNLRAPEPAFDAGPVSPLVPVDSAAPAVDAGAPAPTDVGEPADAGSDADAPVHIRRPFPVGNLRPPPRRNGPSGGPPKGESGQ